MISKRCEKIRDCIQKSGYRWIFCRNKPRNGLLNQSQLSNPKDLEYDMG